MKVLIVIPAYNEEENILNVCNNIFKYCKDNTVKYDIIVINDGSTDNTEEVLYKNNIKHICLIKNLGIGGAVQTGYKYAYENNYDIAVQFDGDGQHNIEYVKSIVEPIEKNEANMVIGSRFCGNDSSFKSSKLRRIGIRIISFFIKLVTGKKVYDTTSGMRAIDKKLIKEFSNNYPTEYPEPVSTTYILKRGYTICEKNVKMNEREYGKSSINTWKSIYYMFNVILSIIVIGVRKMHK